jgi:hypothetical protein
MLGFASKHKQQNMFGYLFQEEEEKEEEEIVKNRIFM